MQQEQPFDQHQSLAIIQQMINTAKQEQKDDGKGWIIWGWVLFTASVGTIINLLFGTLSTFFFWNLFGGFTILFAIYQAVRTYFYKTQVRVKTYTNEIFKKLNVGFFICLMFIIIAMNVSVSPMVGFPLLMNLYGFWILIYGTVLDFKPSIVGAFAMWACALAALFFADTFELVMVLHAAGVVLGYIIPGHIANKEFKKVAGRTSLNSATSV